MNTSEIEDIYPLTPLQQGMLLHYLLDRGLGAYFVQVSYRLNGRLDLDAFRSAWRRLLDRNAILRSLVIWEDVDEPIHVVHRNVELPIEMLDWRDRGSDQQLAEFKELLVADRAEGVALTEAPLMRLTLVRVRDDEHWLLWSYHHLLMEAWSKSLLLNEWLVLYEAFCSGEQPEMESAPPFREFVGWLRKQDRSQAEAFWRSSLAGLTASTPLIGSLRTEQDVVPGDEYGEQHLECRPATASALQSTARAHQVTPSTIVQAAWGLVVSRYSGEHDVLFGQITSLRPPEVRGIDRMVGPLLNALPVRCTISPDMPVSVWLKQLYRQQGETQEYAYNSLIDIQQWSELPSTFPLFQSILLYYNYPQDAYLHREGGTLEIRRHMAVDWTTYPLTVSVTPGDGLGLTIRYDRRRCDDDSITRMLDHFYSVIDGMVTAPDAPLSQIELLSSTERDTILNEWNATGLDYPDSDRTIHELIEEQAERAPNAIAVVSAEEQISYRELSSRSNRLATELRSRGVGPDVIVGLCMERSVEMVVAIVGVLKAGGAFLPLDPEYPSERISYMIENSAVNLIVAHEHTVDRLPASDTTVLVIDREWERIARLSDDFPVQQVDGNNLCYVIYTSGSTGSPKGVMNIHRALTNRLLWMRDGYSLMQEESVLQKTPFSFDVSVWEFLWPLICGARLVMAAPGGHRDPDYLVKLIAEEGIAALHFVPSMLEVFLQQPGVESCSSVRTVISSGEPVSKELEREFFRRLPLAELHNLYGPTEAAIEVSCWRCQAEEHAGGVPMGFPIANVELYVLDSELRPLPVGVEGELYIGGIPLARGYVNNPAMTAERFIPSPFGHSEGARLYRTGDIARHRPDGAIEYVGRLDNQIKLRGNRIELEEIEHVMEGFPGVESSVVVAAENRSGEPVLVSFVVLVEGTRLHDVDLRTYLAKRLPAYMIPAVITAIESLPLMPNGKIDRPTLKAFGGEWVDAPRERVAPRTPAEKRVMEIWATVLDHENFGVTDNFFELGGHSLLATMIVSQLRNAFQVEFPLSRFFDTPTIAGLVAGMDNRNQKRGEELPSKIAATSREGYRRNIPSSENPM